ncbi:uncharacterized protein LOC119560321 [Drosophila subpulchrella]|uniref:uncharacterized protein LOC119560321 n=1 Tax=Drosophila subpulchrella TaxID=1486046 RepID=UPI0018A1B3B7|nr:uncharacterized protein LOC119560321 [Drosophila subpulchrella]
MSDYKFLYKKDANFNIDNQSHQDLMTRTYGFLKATRSDTPIPKSQSGLSAHTLVERLHTIHNKIDYQIESVADEKSFSISSEEPVRMGKSAFEQKRKLFDTAEFTIARGLKLSEFFCPTDSGLHLPIVQRNVGLTASFEEMENYCRKMNIALDK